MNKWLFVIGLMIFLSYLVPYTLLTGVQSWTGSFLFWNVATLAAIFATFQFTRDWEDM